MRRAQLSQISAGTCSYALPKAPLMGSCRQFCVTLNPLRVAVPFRPTFASPMAAMAEQLCSNPWGTALFKAKFGTTRGTQPDYLMNRADKKIEGPFGEKNISRKSRNICRLNGGGVRAHGHFTQGANWRQSQNHIQTLKECLCCHTYCAHLGTPWYQIVGACRAVSDWKSRYPRPTPKNEPKMNKIWGWVI